MLHYALGVDFFPIHTRNTWKILIFLLVSNIPPSLKPSITLLHLGLQWQLSKPVLQLQRRFKFKHHLPYNKINEVCDSTKAQIDGDVIQGPTATEEWTAIAEQFEKRWQFPHCCGALDCRHVAVTCPWTTGSFMYRNYKGLVSIVYVALVDSDNKFL